MNDYDYKVTALLDMVDGDTYELTVRKELNFGFHFHPTLDWTARFRLAESDTPERDEAQFMEATIAAEAWIGDALNKGVLRGRTFKPPLNQMADGQFGRWMIDLYRTDTTEHLNDYLRSKGLST